MRISSLLLCLLLTWSLQSGGQRIGPCPEMRARKPQNIKQLRGVVLGENSALVPNVKVRLQMLDAGDFRDIAVTETDSSGRFSFGSQHHGHYRLVTAFKGLCTATIPIEYSKSGLRGIRLTLPIAASDTCPDYCESRLKVEQMTGREGRE